MGILEITPLIGCDNSCEYCPQVTLIKQYKEKCGTNKEMSLDQFKQYIDTVPTSMDLHFTGYVEPLFAKDTPEMINYAYKKGHKVMLNTTLMGLTKKMWKDFGKNVKFKSIHLHLPSGSYDEMIGVSNNKEKYIHNGKEYKKISPEYIEMVKYVLKNPQYDISGNPPGFHAHGDIHPELKKLEKPNVLKKVLLKLQKLNLVSDNWVFRNLLIISERDINSRAMNILLEKKDKVPEKQNIRGKCPRVTQNVLLPDGHLALCCQDYGLDALMGNLSKQTWSEYQNSKRAKDVFKNGDDICDYCEEGLSYVDDTTWGQWRRLKNLPKDDKTPVNISISSKN